MVPFAIHSVLTVKSRSVGTLTVPRVATTGTVATVTFASIVEVRNMVFSVVLAKRAPQRALEALTDFRPSHWHRFPAI